MNKEIYQFFQISLSWLKVHGLRIAIVFILSIILIRVVNSLVARLVRKIISRDSFVSEEEEKKREDTIIKILHRLSHILIWFGFVFFLLQEFGIPIAPLLTGAGILGMAVGFGAQSLVRDFITGLFIVTENQFRIGDVVCIGDYCGVVEDMTLRITKLREMDGTIHYIPNSEIRVASNKSKDFSKIDIKIGVAYHTDIDHLEKVINSIGEEIKRHQEYGKFVIETPHFLRIDEFGDSAIIVRIIGTVYPKKQYLIEGELNRIIKQRFEEEGIEIPYPTRTVVLQNKEK